MNNLSHAPSSNNITANISGVLKPVREFTDSNPSAWNESTSVSPMDINETLLVLQFYEETHHFERQVGIIIPSIFAVFALLGLIGNLLVVIVALNRQMRNSTNTLIIGLTCSDLMFLTLCIPFTGNILASIIHCNIKPLTMPRQFGCCPLGCAHW